MSLSSIPAVASTGLAVNQARLDASAQRVANMATLRASPDPAPSPPPASTAPDPERAGRLRQADRETQQITHELISQRVELYHFKANVGVVQTASQAMGTLLDLAG